MSKVMVLTLEKAHRQESFQQYPLVEVILTYMTYNLYGIRGDRALEVMFLSSDAFGIFQRSIYKLFSKI